MSLERAEANDNLAIYDDVRWHTEEDFPSDLPTGAAATHMGAYFAWAVRQGLHAAPLESAYAEGLAKLRAGHMTGGQFILSYFQGQLNAGAFNALGRRFSDFYYADEEEGYGRFMSDYVRTLNTPALLSLYHVADTPQTLARLTPVFDQAFSAWQGSLKQ